MKLFKEFLSEAAQPEWRVSFKKQKMNGVAVDEKPVTVKARDSREAIVKAAKKVGISDKSVAMQMKTKSIDKLDESLTEALIDKLEKFAGKKIKPGRVTIKGYPVDVTDSDGSYIEMDAVDRAAAEDLAKALRKDGFKAKRVGSLGILVEESLTEAKYEVEVEVRDARAANDLAKDMFRGSYKNDGSNVFIFKNEDDYEEFKYELENAGLKLMEQVQVDEAQNQKNNFERALNARDAEIEIVRATHPLAKGNYSIKVYAPSVDKNVVFYADVTQFRGDFMS